MKLEGKTYYEVAKALAGKNRDQLVDLIYELSSFEGLMTSGEIAKRCHIKPREVVADMKAGRFVDPIFGRGFFSRARNSFKVSVSAANRWRREWFIPRESRSIPVKKNGADTDALEAQNQEVLEQLRRIPKEDGGMQIGVRGENARQNGELIVSGDRGELAGSAGNLGES